MRECSHCESLIPLHYLICPVCGVSLKDSKTIKLKIGNTSNNGAIDDNYKTNVFVEDSELKEDELIN